jgi:hypothetical protein
MSRKRSSYDVLVLAHGTHRFWPKVPAAQTKAQYLDDGEKRVARLEDARGVVSESPERNITEIGFGN